MAALARTDQGGYSRASCGAPTWSSWLTVWRVRFDLNDWQRMNLEPGQRVPVRWPGREDVWLFIRSATELPHIVGGDEEASACRGAVKARSTTVG